MVGVKRGVIYSLSASKSRTLGLEAPAPARNRTKSRFRPAKADEALRARLRNKRPEPQVYKNRRLPDAREFRGPLQELIIYVERRSHADEYARPRRGVQMP